ncbi:acyl-CoA dehydrogenase/oxidase [Aspergillus stella-maris]|uniref:acyl-CoA dehydrogenase/oxidase n=1 Tax=Aspergillus stella-maris TaxID=1810926 RepID=UPI003CCD16A1
MPDFTDTLRPAEPSGPSLLAHERSLSPIAVDKLSQHLLSHDGFLQRQSRVLPILQSHPLLQKTQQANLSRPSRFKLALARAKLLRRLADEHAWSPEEHEMAEYLVDDVSPYMLHMGMFITTIREQASDAQREEWLPKIKKWEIIGAYAQTELGHGSNVRGLELEARYDVEKGEFVLHSPTLTASKWWNGTLGRTANHAVVVAQLMLPDLSDTGGEGKEGRKYVLYGPHPFIVQVRDMKTHQPFEGIVIGDIGPKYGYASMDNAYMLFNHFRIPHSALLSRYSSVDPSTGAYKKPTQSAVVYGTLTYMRSKIIQHARLVLARAVTVAVRYTTIRRQFADRDGSPDSPSTELPVLDYPTVQVRILPLLATTFALHYTGLAMQRIYVNTRKQIHSGDFGSLAYMHSMSSGLKSLCTTLAADGIETCRRALGGHGYGGGSGLVQLNNDYLSKPTVEGDNWMITQQTAAYLVKKVGAVLKGQGGMAGDEVDGQFRMYIPRIRDGGKVGCEYDILGNDGDLVRSFQHKATALAYEVYQERVVRKKSWTSLMIQFHKLSKAQSQSMLVTQFYEALSGANDLPSDTVFVLWDLYRLFALFTLQEDRYEFFRHTAASCDQLDLVPERINQLISRIRPHAVQLVDSWKIPDYLLDSALGRYDGRVYEDLFHRAHRLNPLNRITVNPNYWEDEIVKGGQDLKGIVSKL